MTAKASDSRGGGGGLTALVDVVVAVAVAAITFFKSRFYVVTGTVRITVVAVAGVGGGSPGACARP